MSAVISFVVSHETFLCTIGGLVLQEFIANSKLASNSIGQMAIAYLKGFFASKTAPKA